ncbi:hypothetical protein [Comamonas testosteroni]|uniref:Uncharacterized protein n=1 Tax=Comamonas testosteroni TaxID=285 RepID=A0A8B4SA83_COMTE|nr:hypothetical protein [Comamonas testosteroni]EHN66062.1 hypothetical protein CTATCC11996_09812 [Comamonas testosteroni ATCC 11996]QQN71880.1 hypothetical protein IYN88_11010 [Comamonas testosteroni]SUY79448.1 Uncharacterised protein [Comamonas testosteroni]
MHDFIAQISQQWLQLPDCQTEHKDAARTRITSSAAAGCMDVEFFVHHGGNGSFSATRYEEAMQLGAEHRLHAWITLRDAAGEVIHHEVSCNPGRFAQLLHEWRAAPDAAPEQVTIQALACSPSTDETETCVPSMDQELNLGLLDELADAQQALERLKADVAAIDLMRLLQSWPRDDRGRPAARTTAVLAAYGPATRKRQPCLLVRSVMQSKMPGWQLLVSSEFLYNCRHQWSDARWLWSPAEAPKDSALERKARNLMAQGKVSEACALYGIELHERVRRLAASQSFQRFSPAPEAWVQELRAALLQLAPWRLTAGLQRIQEHLIQANRKPPKPGSWERKLFWFSGQRQQARWGPGVRFNEDGKPVLDLIVTASNEHFPVPDWKQQPR